MKKHISKMKIIGSMLALGLVVVLLSHTILADRIYFPFGFINKLFNFQKENQLTIGPYKDGTIILVKPVATGVGSSRAEAGDVVEIRDAQELYQRFGNDKPFLGKRERTKLLVFYYAGQLTQEQKDQLLTPVYETHDGTYITQQELEQITINQTETNEETDLEQEPQIIKNRAYGIDYTQLLSEKDILIARDPNKEFDKLPELDLTYLIKKEPDQFSVVEMTDKLVRAESITQTIEDTLYQIIPLAQAQTACVSIVDPDNGDGTDYLSLNTWESTEERDLVTANETETATCRSTSGTADTTAVTIDNWTTDATRYIKVWTDPDEDYRHNGVWDETAYRLEDDRRYYAIIYILEKNTRIEGLQIEQQSNYTDGGGGIREGTNTGASEFYFSNNIIKCTGTKGVGGASGIITTTSADNHVYKIWNNIIYDFEGGIKCSADSGSEDYVYNNTIVDCGRMVNKGVIDIEGYPASASIVKLKNNLVQGSERNYYLDFGGNVADEYVNNLSEDSYSPNDEYDNLEVNFVDEDNDDFHLSASSDARDAGADLSDDANLAFSDDIDGDVRGSGGAWDIGADERTGTAIRSSTAKPIYGVEVDTNHPLADGLVGAWLMNEGGGTIVHDSSGNGNDGTLTNGPTWDNGGLDFSSSGDYVDLGTLSLDNQRTFTVITKAVLVSQTYRHIICNSAHYDYFSIGNFMLDTSLKGYLCGYPWEIANASDDEFHTVAVTAQASTAMHVYLDGVHVNNIGGNVPAVGAEIDTESLWLGNREGLDRDYSGKIEYTFVYDRALSADEIAQLYREPYAMFKNKTKINTSQEGVVTDGLVGYWSFDGPDMDWSASSAEAIDTSGEGNHGDVTNMAPSSVRSGISGQALDFDGVDDYIVTSDVPDGLSQITACTWVKASASNAGTILILAESNLLYLGRAWNEKFEFTIYNASAEFVTASSDTTYADTNWHFVCGTYDGATVDMYVDGIDDNADTDSQTGLIRDFGGAVNMNIGNTSISWDGLIDEVRIYNRALSESEIGELYQAGTRRMQIRE